MAFFSVRGSPVARVLLSSWPDRDFRFTPVEWHELMHGYFGSPSPSLRPFVGQTVHIGTQSFRVDAHGLQGLLARTLPGDHHRLRHDRVKWALHNALQAMSL